MTFPTMSHVFELNLSKAAFCNKPVPESEQAKYSRRTAIKPRPYPCIYFDINLDGLQIHSGRYIFTRGQSR